MNLNLKEDDIELNISRDTLSRSNSGGGKRVHFAPNKQVKFSTDQEMNE
jgi:hypothetical protein